MGLTIFQVDAFTDRPFAGNPAAVCVLPEPRDEGWMQNVAQEMPVPATAFQSKHADGFDLCWFTATVELKLCRLDFALIAPQVSLCLLVDRRGAHEGGVSAGDSDTCAVRSGSSITTSPVCQWPGVIAMTRSACMGLLRLSGAMIPESTPSS
jgi:predicted PhzF superfamily epimerase YddE/YHI9